MKLCYDITEVCRLLGVTSRTLRFYESQGIIQSTVTPFSKRRMYTEAQLSEIRNVLLLRKLGLSVKSIGELQKNHISLEHALSERRMQLYALLEEKHRELAVITQALSALGDTDRPEDLLGSVNTTPNENLLAIADTCAKAVATGDTEGLYRHFGKRLSEYLPMSAFEAGRRDTLSPLGELTAIEDPVCDPDYPHIVYQTLWYGMYGVCVKMVFYGEKLEGIWLAYRQKGNKI